MFLVPIFLILFYWKETLLHLSTHLYSWLDGPFVIWVFQNNIRHFSQFDIVHLYETNAMYPFPYSLSFTEHMFFPTLFIWFFSFFTSNPLLQFNLFAVLNHLLIYFCFFLLAGRFTKNFSVKVIVSFFVAFSPYFIGQVGHLQMVIFWPLLMSLYYVAHPKRSNMHIVFAGVWLGIQFLSAVYLGMLGFGIVASYYLFNIPKSDTARVVKEISLSMATFILVSLPSVIGYLLMQKMYKPVYEQSQYVTYSAHISDYFLIFVNNSFVNIYFFRPLIGILNHHKSGEMASFVGIVPILVVSGWWLAESRAKFKKILKYRSQLLWLVFLIVIGFVFSLGPRMNWNGTYLVTPLPYWFVLKFVPLIGVMRAVARYYFLIIFALSILLLYSLDSIYSGIRNPLWKKLFLPITFLLFVIEIYPAPLQTSSRQWISPSYLFLQKACQNNSGAVFMYPFEYRDRAKNIGKYLSIKTNALLSSTLYACPTLSGFSSFEPLLYKQWQEDFDTNGIGESQLKILKAHNFRYVRINREALNDVERMNPKIVIKTNGLVEIYSDAETIIYAIK